MSRTGRRAVNTSTRRARGYRPSTCCVAVSNMVLFGLYEGSNQRGKLYSRRQRWTATTTTTTTAIDHKVCPQSVSSLPVMTTTDGAIGAHHGGAMQCICRRCICTHYEGWRVRPPASLVVPHFSLTRAEHSVQVQPGSRPDRDTPMAGVLALFFHGALPAAVLSCRLSSSPHLALHSTQPEKCLERQRGEEARCAWHRARRGAAFRLDQSKHRGCGSARCPGSATTPMCLFLSLATRQPSPSLSLSPSPPHPRVALCGCASPSTPQASQPQCQDEVCRARPRDATIKRRTAMEAEKRERERGAPK